MKRTTEYQANDGTRFATADECRRHEQGYSIECLVGMNDDQVKDALARTNVQLADAIEYAGKLIGERRRTMGDVRRKRKPIAEKHDEVGAPITEMQPKKAKK